MCSKVVLVDDHLNFNHRRDEVNLLFALLFPPMSESVLHFQCFLLLVCVRLFWPDAFFCFTNDC